MSSNYAEAISVFCVAGSMCEKTVFRRVMIVSCLLILPLISGIKHVNIFAI